MRLVQAYAAVHRTRPAAIALVVFAMIGTLIANVDIPTIGDGRLIAGPLTAACACGVVGALAQINDAPVLAPPSARSSLARSAWIALTLTAAVTTGSISAMVSSEVEVAATARNVLIAWSLAVLTILIGQPDLAWVLPMLALACSVMFTTADEDLNSVEWWGLLLNKQLLRLDAPIAIGLTGAAVILALAFGGREKFAS